MNMDLSKLWEILKDRGVLACCNPWNGKELAVTYQLNNNLNTPHRQGGLTVWKPGVSWKILSSLCLTFKVRSTSSGWIVMV